MAYTVINPNFPESMEEELAGRPKRAPRPLIKLHPYLHRYPVTGPNYRLLWEFAHRTSAVVLSHTWESDATCGPLMFEEPAKAVLEAGKHLAIEKPMTTSAAEADELLRLARSSGRKVQVNYNHRWLGPYHHGKQAVLKGDIGTPLAGFARRNDTIFVPTEYISWAARSTPVEFLERRFSVGLRQVFAWSGIPLKVIDEGLKTIAVGLFVSKGLGMSLTTAILLTGIIIIIYTALGGLWAVFITDFIQFVLVTTAVLLLLPLSLSRAGGIQSFISRAPEGFFHAFHPPYTGFYLLGFVLLVSLSMSGNWSLVQRFYAARSEQDARRVGWTAGVLFLLLPPVWIVAGMAARLWLPGNWAQNNDPQYVYAEISRLLLPPGLLGLIVAALFAATMSVLSAGYNVIASVLTVDVYQRHIRPQASQRHLLVVGKILTVAVGLTATAVAGLVLHFRWTIFDTMVTAFGFFLPPTVLPVLAGLVWPRITSRGACYTAARPSSSGCASGIARFNPSKT